MKFDVREMLKAGLAVQSAVLGGRIQAEEELRRRGQQELQTALALRNVEQDDFSQRARMRSEMLGLLEPGTPEYEQAAGGITGEINRLSGIQQNFYGSLSPAARRLLPGGYGQQQAPAPAPRIGVQQAAMPGTAPAASPFRDPRRDKTFDDLHAQAEDLFNQAQTTGDTEAIKALSALRPAIISRRLGLDPKVYETHLSAVMQKMQAAGTGRAVGGQVRAALENLQDLGLKGAIKPEADQAVRTLIARGRGIDVSTPAGVQAAQAWIKEYETLTGSGLTQPGYAERLRQQEITGAEEARKSVATGRLQSTYDKLWDNTDQALTSGSPKAFLEAVRALNAFVDKNPDLGLPRYGGTEFSEQPRAVPTTLPYSPLPKPGTVEPPLLSGTAAAASERPETQEEIQARLLVSAADRVEEGPVRQRFLREGAKEILALVRSPRWGTMSDAEKSAVLRNLGEFEQRMGMPEGGLLPSSLKADQLPPEFRERQKQAQQNLQARLMQLEETTRHHLAMENKPSAKYSAPGYMTDVEKAELAQARTNLSKLYGEARALQGKSRLTDAEETRLKELAAPGGPIEQWNQSIAGIIATARQRSPGTGAPAGAAPPQGVRAAPAGGARAIAIGGKSFTLTKQQLIQRLQASPRTRARAQELADKYWGGK